MDKIGVWYLGRTEYKSKWDINILRCVSGERPFAFDRGGEFGVVFSLLCFWFSVFNAAVLMSSC